MSNGPSPEALARYAETFTNSLSLKAFGLRIAFPTVDKVEIHLDQVRPEHRGGLGTDAVNGGVLAAVFDLAIGCTPALVDPTRRSATVQLSMSFERPVVGERLHAVATIDVAGGSTIFSTARIFDAQGRECARCQGVVKIANVKWASGVSPAIN